MMIQILGKQYEVIEAPYDIDAHTDRETRTIYISDKLDDRRYRKILRREIIKAFLRESDNRSSMIDWIAEMYPKIDACMEKLYITY